MAPENTSSSDLFFNLIQNAPLGVYLVDADFRLAQISAGCRRVFSGIEPLLGRDFSEILRIVWPEPFASEALAYFHHTLATGEPYHSPDTTERRGNVQTVESYDWQIERVVMPDGRFGAVCYFYETTDRVNAEQDARFLSDIAERIRVMTDPAEFVGGVLHTTAVYLALDRCYLSETDEAQDKWSVANDYHGDLPSIAGQYRVSDYPAGLADDLRAGRHVICEDCKEDARWSEFYEAAFAPLSVRAFVAVPLRRDGRWLTTLVAVSQRPRRWLPREIALLEAISERMWSAVARAHDEAALRKSEAALRRAHDGLESRVRQRTAELAHSNAALQEELRDRRAAEEQIKALFECLVTAQESERRRIARDIHDQLGQQLTALRLHLDALPSFGDDPQRPTAVGRARALAEELDHSVDFLTWHLRPAALDHLGLSDALQQLVTGWSERFGIPAEYETTGSVDGRFPADVESNLYRIAQEALHNVYKHARAHQVHVRLEHRDSHSVLTIVDDGCGFGVPNLQRAPAPTGLGLVNMRERAALCGGELEITSTSSGTNVRVTRPAADARAQASSNQPWRTA